MGLMKWLGMDDGCKDDQVEITDTNFKDVVVQSEVPVMIDVWSPGCQPCVALADTVKRLACKYDGQVKVAHLNAQAYPRISSKLRVTGTPTVLFFKNGAAKERVVGVRGQHRVLVSRLEFLDAAALRPDRTLA